MDVLLKSREFEPREEEITAILDSKRDLATLSLLGYLNSKRDARALPLARLLWGKYKSDDAVQVRYAVVTPELAGIPNASDVFLEFLKSLDADGPSSRSEDLRWRIFAALRNGKPSAPLRDYVTAVLNRTLSLPKEEDIKSLDDLRMLYDQVRSREWARVLSKTWGLEAQDKVDGTEAKKKT